MQIDDTGLAGVKLVTPRVFRDDRGYFFETYQEDRYDAAGIASPFLQDNVSKSRKGVLRGLHFQHPNPQGKLVGVLDGEVFDVAVDLRKGSPQFGQWYGTILSGENHRQLWIPEGFAHGFLVLSEIAIFAYKCTALYSAEDDRSVRWNDPAIGIEWPSKEPVLSPKDANAPLLAELREGDLPDFSALHAESMASERSP